MFIISLNYPKTYPQTWCISLSYLDGLVQDCSNSIANALELLQSCTKPLIHVLAAEIYDKT